MRRFSPKKFLLLPLPQKHKKCAELLRSIYFSLFVDCTEKEKAFSDLVHYNQIQEWMHGVSLAVHDVFTISDRYHWHLKNAHVSLKEHNLLPDVQRRDRPKKKSPSLSVAVFLDRLRSAHNVGSILRTVEAFALGKVYFSSHTPFIDQKQVKDTSMGTFEWIDCIKNASLMDLPKPIIALETCKEAIPLSSFLFPPIFSLVIGNEEYGCSPEVLKAADYIVEIPLHGRKNSLNAANAFAIAAAEIRRQHPGPLNPFN